MSSSKGKKRAASKGQPPAAAKFPKGAAMKPVATAKGKKRAAPKATAVEAPSAKVGKRMQLRSVTLAFSIFSGDDDENGETVLVKLRLQGQRVFVNDKELLYQKVLAAVSEEDVPGSSPGDYKRFQQIMNNGEDGLQYPSPVEQLWQLETIDCFVWLMLQGYKFPSTETYHFDKPGGTYYGEMLLKSDDLDWDNPEAGNWSGGLGECKLLYKKALECEKLKQ